MSDSKEIAVGGAGGLPADPNQTNASSLLGQIIQASRDPEVDAGKMEAMARLAIELQDRDLRAQFNRDKANALFEMPAIYKRGKSDKHRYAKFEDLHRAVAPILRKYNLVLNFKVGSMPNGHVAVTPVLAHRNGLDEQGETLTGPPDQGPGRTPIQAVGSSASYLKRHAAKAILNLIEDGEDNDGATMLPDHQLNDRQAHIAEEAELMAAADGYAVWFDQLPPRDRAWLISTGRHAQFGGALALPGSSALPPREPDAAQPRQQKRTPEQMVEAYEGGVASQNTLDDLVAYQTDEARAKWIGKIKDQRTDLHERIVAANTRRFAELSQREAESDTAGDGLFPEE